MKLWMHTGDKPFVLNQKEKDRAEEGWTVVSRPHPKGGHIVAAVNVETGYPHMGRGYHAEPNEVSRAAEEAMRWLSKMGAGGKAADVARNRYGKKQYMRNHPPVKEMVESLLSGHDIDEIFSGTSWTKLLAQAAKLPETERTKQAKYGRSPNHRCIECLPCACAELKRQDKSYHWDD